MKMVKKEEQPIAGKIVEVIKNNKDIRKALLEGCHYKSRKKQNEFIADCFENRLKYWLTFTAYVPQKEYYNPYAVCPCFEFGMRVNNRLFELEYYLANGHIDKSFEMSEEETAKITDICKDYVPYFIKFKETN